MAATETDPFDALSGEPFLIWRCLGAPKRFLTSVADAKPALPLSSADKPRMRPKGADVAKFAAPGTYDRADATSIVEVIATAPGIVSCGPHLVGQGISFVELFPDEIAEVQRHVATPADIARWQAAERQFEDESLQWLVKANGERESPYHQGYPAANGVTAAMMPLTVQGIVERRRHGRWSMEPAWTLPAFLSVRVVRENVSRQDNALTRRLADAQRNDATTDALRAQNAALLELVAELKAAREDSKPTKAAR